MKEVDITICGLDNAGKTTLVKYLETGRFVDTQPTMGVNRAETVHFANLEINIFDLGGQEDFRELWPEINEKSNGIIFVVDSADVMRFEEAKKVFHQVISTQVHRDVIVLVLLHKSDLENRMEKTKFMKEFDLMNVRKKWGCYETSAKTGENIVESFSWFVTALKETVDNG